MACPPTPLEGGVAHRDTARAQTLIDLALEAGGRDNVTALLVKCETP